MRQRQPKYAIVLYNDGSADTLAPGADLPRGVHMGKVVDESQFDWDLDGLLESAVVFEAPPGTALEVKNAIAEFCATQLDIDSTTLPRKHLNGEDYGSLPLV